MRHHLLIVIVIFATMIMSSVDALSQSIVVVGLNAALQKRFILPPSTNLQPGNVHRCSKCETGVGGKGQDVGVALSCLMSTTTEKKQKTPDINDNKVLLAQFLGQGAEGEQVSNILKKQHGLSDALTIRNLAPLRTCTTIVGESEATELVETSGEVTPTEMKALQDKVDELTNTGGKANCICIMGSMPPGCHDDTYADLTSRLADKESLVLIDSVIGLKPLLRVLKSIFDDNSDNNESGEMNDNNKKKKGGAVLKLNAAELCKLAGVDKSSGETAQITREELISATNGFVTKYTNACGALDYLCITDGKFPGHLVEVTDDKAAPSNNNFRTWQLSAVDLSNEGMLYPIGAGDTVAAGTLAAWQYLHFHSSDDNNFFGVIPSKIGTQLTDKMNDWGSDKSVVVPPLATAFAFGTSCGSASCLKEENSVFNVEDAKTFFNGMDTPSVQ